MYTNELFHFLVEEVLPIVGCFLVPIGISCLIRAFADLVCVLNNSFSSNVKKGD